MAPFILLVCLVTSCLAAGPVVKVQQGSLQGLQVAGLSPYNAFRGIPYAAPPVGSLRFRAPRPPNAWTGIRNATVEAGVCSQATFTGQLIGGEDCLYLNVYTPQLTCSSPLPVVVFLHSSAFVFGDGGRAWYGPDYFTYNNVILVTFNYRLGPFGFLNLRSAGAPGNAGLKDTLAALQWVKNNIKSFCGDPSRVTLSGHSAGAMMAGVHVLSSKSAGLFYRAFLMSGNALTSSCYTENSLEAGRELAARLVGRDNTTAGVERTLRAATGPQINAANLALLTSEPQPTVMFKFAMSIESPAASNADLAGSAFLTKSPEALLRNPEVARPVPMLTGTAAQEGTSLFALASISPAFNGNVAALLQRVNARFLEVLQRLALYVPEDVAQSLKVSRGVGTAAQQQAIFKLVRDKYAGGKPTFTREQYIQITTDMEFVGPLVNYLRLCRGQVYLYESDVQTSYDFVRAVLRITYANETTHGDDLGWLFKPSILQLNQNYNGTGLAPSVLRYFVKMATDWAKGKTVGTPQACRVTSTPYIHINGATPTAATGYGSTAALWEQVFDMRRK